MTRIFGKWSPRRWWRWSPSLLRVYAVSVLLLVFKTASGIQLGYSTHYGELVEGGWASVHIHSTASLPVDCYLPGPIAARVGNEISVSVLRARPGSECLSQKVWVGRVAAGPYTVTAQIRAGDGTVLESVTEVVTVPELGETGCRQAEAGGGQDIETGNYDFADFWGRPAAMTAGEFVARHASDREFAALASGLDVWELRGGVAFTASGAVDDDIPTAMARLAPLFTRDAMREPSFSRYDNRCESGPWDEMLIEYFDPSIGYIYYPDRFFEPVGTPTGQRLNLGPWACGVPADTLASPIYLFSNSYRVPWNNVYRTLPTQFVTANPKECRAARRSGRWSNAMMWNSYTGEPNADGSCSPHAHLTSRARVPLYRAWRPFGESVHRFSTDRAVIDEMVSQGWLDEGAVMCVLPPA